jgi:copper(I)-binding protein
VRNEELGIVKDSLVYRYLLAVLIVIAIPGLALDERGNESQGNQVLIEKIWSRATPPGVGNGVVYMDISNLSADNISLVRVSSDRVKRAEIHESVIHDTMMHMQHRKSVTIGPGELQRFEPGALHVMLMGLQEQLSEGDEFEVTLHFSAMPPIVIRVPVFSIAQSSYPEPG